MCSDLSARSSAHLPAERVDPVGIGPALEQPGLAFAGFRRRGSARLAYPYGNPQHEGRLWGWPAAFRWSSQRV